MPPDHLLSRSAKRQIIAFFGYRKPIEYSKEWSFLQNVSALLPGEAIERMPNLIYRSICSSNLHWLTTSGDFRGRGTDTAYGFVLQQEFTREFLNIIFDQEQAEIVDRFHHATTTSPTLRRIVIVHYREWAWPDNYHAVAPCPTCTDLTARSNSHMERFANEVYHFDNPTTGLRLTATVKIGAVAVWDQFRREWRSCTTRKRTTEVHIEFEKTTTCKSVIAGNTRRSKSVLRDDAMREVFLCLQRADIEACQLVNRRLRSVTDASPFAMPLREILAAVETFRALAIYHAPLNEGALGRLVHYSLEGDAVVFPLRNCFVQFFDSNPVDEESAKAAFYRLISMLPNDFIQLKIHTFGAKSLRPLQNPDRTHMDRYAILERAEATFKPSSYGFKLNLFDGEAAFDITHLGILEEKSLRLWMGGSLDAVLQTAEVANRAWQAFLFRSRSPFFGVVNWSDSEDDNEKSPFDLDGVLRNLVTSEETHLTVDCFEVIALGACSLDFPSSCVTPELEGIDVGWRYFEPEARGIGPMQFAVYYLRNAHSQRDYTVVTGSRGTTLRVVRVHQGLLDEAQLSAATSSVPYAFLYLSRSSRIPAPYCMEG